MSKILVVEDNAESRYMLERLLEVIRLKSSFQIS